jgi:tetratricopeptide (TPR) repeat protein
MPRKYVIIIVFVILFLYATGMSLLYIGIYNKNKQLSEGIEESNSFKKKLQEELSALNSTQEVLGKENEQLKNESLNYLKKQKESNETLEGLKTEIEKRMAKINELQKELMVAKQEAANLKSENEKLVQIDEFTAGVQVKKQQQKIINLEKDLANSKEQVKKQEALLHYNLGVAYTKEKNYEMALDEYRRALKLNPKDPDTYYNLAILYDDCFKNPKRAMENYRKYLELRPNAPDIDEVKEWILRLEK